MSVRRAPAVEPARATGPDRFVPYAERATATMLAMPPMADTDMPYGVDKEAQRKGRIEDRAALAKRLRDAQIARRRGIIGIDYKNLPEATVEFLFGRQLLPGGSGLDNPRLPGFFVNRVREDRPDAPSEDGQGVFWGNYRRTGNFYWLQNDGKLIKDAMLKVDNDVEFAFLGSKWQFAWNSFADMVAWAWDHAIGNFSSPGKVETYTLNDALVATYKTYNVLMGMVKDDAKGANEMPELTRTLSTLLNDTLINIIKHMRDPENRGPLTFMADSMKNVKSDPVSGLIVDY